MKRTYSNQRASGTTGAARRNESTQHQQQQQQQQQQHLHHQNNMYNAPQSPTSYYLNPAIPPPYYGPPPPQSQMGMMPYMTPGANYMYPGGPHQPGVPSWNYNSPPPPLPTDESSRALPPLPPGHPPNHQAGPPSSHPPGMRGRGMNRYRGDNRNGNRRSTPYGTPRQNMPNNYSGKMQSKKQPNEAGFTNNIEMTNHNFDENHIQVNKKSKRKPMSTRYTRAKEWDREDAIKALSLEREYNRLQKTPMLILKFPDPELNKHIVKQYSPFIETVHFQQPSTPRYCFIQLKEGADIDQISEELSKIPFGTGRITAEKKHQGAEESQPVGPEEIDPYTLYIGNLPTQVSVKVVKEHFPTAQRIDIGYAQRMKYTRYAFIRYNSVEESMEAYRKTFNQLIESRSLIVRFRRQKGNIGLPGETKVPNPRKDATTRKGKPDQNLDTDLTIDDTTDLDSEIDMPTTSLISPSAKSSGCSEDSVDTTELDSKANVLKQARRIMHHNKDSNRINLAVADSNTNGDIDFGVNSVKNEPPCSSRTFDDDRDNNINLLGTRIKDEPLDDDALLAQAHCYDDDLDDDLDCEEDDTIPDEFDNSANLENFIKGPIPDWEEFRRTELSRQEIKPNLNEIMPNSSTDDLLPDAKKLKLGEKKRDEMDDLFDSLNPEEDDDSDIGF